MTAQSSTAVVLSNEPLTPEIRRLVLSLPPGWGPPLPGQFVQLECPPHDQFGLCRPFGLSAHLASAEETRLEIVYGAVGTRTRALAASPPGERLLVIGPLGKPYRAVPGRRPVLVGGGRGITPLCFLAEELAPALPDGIIVYGVRTAEQRIPLDALPYPVRVATEDGSLGYSGTVIGLLDSLALPAGGIALYACGPNRMLQALTGWAVSRGVFCQVSLETYFGCGFGICAGCAVPLHSREGETAFERYALACQDGPVMDGARVDWENLKD